jgi:regulatory protein YycH of two-component signal transduction system YycFG
VTNEEILEAARQIKSQKMEANYQNRLEKARIYAETVKANPVTVEGEVKRVYAYEGPVGNSEVVEIQKVINRLPKGTKVRAVLEVIEIGPGLPEWDSDDDD